jgi:hypothetical protein
MWGTLVCRVCVCRHEHDYDDILLYIEFELLNTNKRTTSKMPTLLLNANACRTRREDELFTLGKHSTVPFFFPHVVDGGTFPKTRRHARKATLVLFLVLQLLHHRVLFPCGISSLSSMMTTAAARAPLRYRVLWMKKKGTRTYCTLDFASQTSQKRSGSQKRQSSCFFHAPVYRVE